MSLTKVAIIGCGGIANGKHMPSLKRTGMCEMTAFCDLVKERAEKAAAEYGVKNAKVCTDYKELLADPDVEVVHVCTPNRSHSKITVDALNAGKHVMCEKPMAINYQEALKMVEAAKANNKLLTVGYQQRNRPDAAYLKAECERGTLGEIYFAKARSVRRRGVPTWGVFLNEYEQGGGALIDIGTHALDMCMWLMRDWDVNYVVGTSYHKHNNDTETANLFGDWDVNQFTADDASFGFIVMKSGATIFLEATWALNTLDLAEAKVELCGTGAGADMVDGLRINGVKNNRQYIETPDFSTGGVAFFEGSQGGSPADIEQMIWMNAVNGKGKLSVLPEQAAAVTRCLDAVYESAKTGKPVYFK